MNLSKRLNRRLQFAATSLLAFALFAPAALMQQSGGPYIINPSVVAGGGGTSANGNMSIVGTIGQGTLGASTGGSFSLDGGFWQAIQAPAVGNSISGTISYCIDQTKKVPNATVNTTSGSPSDTTTTNALGFYELDNLGVGPYTVAPSKTGAVSGITAFDAALVAQYVADIATPTSCQQLAGDSSNNGGLSAFDAALIAQTVAVSLTLASPAHGSSSLRAVPTLLSWPT